MADVTEAFGVGIDGLLFEDGAHMICGASVPTFNATVPTVYIQTNGNIYTNPGGLTWTPIGSSTQSSNFDYYHILTGQLLTIEAGQVMNPSHLELKGCLKLDGCLELQ